MLWQDWVFSVGSWIFVAALIPTIRGKQKPEISTSLTTGTVLGIFAIAYLTLNLWLSTASTLVTSASWFILAYQKHRQE
ncbi:MAG: hypothetical protein Q7S45_02345 [Candidatus Curtissbacteria bacterium]|nr:hypothetical protein [Candidatus Curtissbacteria bacterium]